MLVLVGLLLVTGWWDHRGQLAAGPPRRELDGEPVSTSDVRAEGTEETGTWQPSGDRDHHRRSGELTAWELVRWAWRQLTSMRTALVLLLLLALGAIPGLGDPAARGRRAEDPELAGRPPAPDADLRPARAVRRLPLAVVRRDLPAAVDLAGRLHRAAAVRLLARLPAPTRRRRRAT